MIGGTSASVTAWADTSITATVGAQAVTGVAKVQQTGQWSNAVAFVVPSANQLALAPSVLGMVVGETRPIQSLNVQGTPVTGLAWSSSDVTVATLSASDPPDITAVGPGTATIRAGNVSADVTVYAGSLSEGTVRWSHNGNGSGVVASYIAVPNYDGVADVFLEQEDGSIQAVTADGIVGWAVTPPTPLAARRGMIPDFKGGLVVQTYDSLYALHPGTGAPGPVFTTANDEARLVGIGDPAIHPDGTVLTIDYACHDACPGNVETEDGAWVVGVNPTTGTAAFRVPLANSIDTLTVNDAAFCQAAPGTTTWRYHAWPSRLLIAGDGFAYLSYLTFDVVASVQRAAAQPYADTDYGLWDTVRSATNASQFASAIAALDALGSAIGTSSTSSTVASLRTALQNGDRTLAMSYENQMAPWFRRPCDGQWTRVRKLHVMRVGPDGSSSDVVVKTWTDAETDVYALASGWTPGTILGVGATAYHETVTHAGGEAVQTDTRTITNADTGVLVSWKARISCYPGSTIGSRTYVQADACPASDERLTTVTAGAITTDVPWQPGTAATAPPVEPQLQLDDVAFAGVRATPTGSGLVVFDGNGTIRWTRSGFYPERARPGGGVVASSALSTIEFDTTGSQQRRLRFVPSSSSWFGQVYVDRLTQIVSQVLAPAPTFAAILLGNASRNTTAIKQALASGPPELVEQHPPSDLLHTVKTNHNSVELSTTLTPAEVFERYIPTFAGAQYGTNSAGYVTSPLPVVGPCDMVSFRVKGFENWAVGEFSVAATQLNRDTSTVSVVTLRGHPLAGWRFWRAFASQPGRVVIETGAIDTQGPGKLNYFGFYWSRGAQLRMWRDYLSYVLRDMLTNNLGQRVSGTAYDKIQGSWGYPQQALAGNIVPHLPASCP